MSSLNPFQAIEKLIVEHGSSVVQEKHIAFLREQLSAIKEERSLLLKQLSDSGADNKILRSENENLNQKIKEYEKPNDLPEHLDTPAFFVLTILAGKVSGASTGHIAHVTGQNVNDVMFHIDEFLEWGLVQLTRADTGAGCWYRLTAQGRAYYRKLDAKEHKS